MRWLSPDLELKFKNTYNDKELVSFMNKWQQVTYKEELNLLQKVKVKSTGHVGLVSKIVDTNKFGENLNCKCYNISPKDPNDAGGHRYFSHLLEKEIFEK